MTDVCHHSIGAKRIFKYIEIPDYASHGMGWKWTGTFPELINSTCAGVDTNIRALLRDEDITKVDETLVELGEMIGQGGQVNLSLSCAALVCLSGMHFSV